MQDSLKENPNLPIPIVQLDLLGKYISEYKSMLEASSKTLIPYSIICDNCKGKTMRVKDFIFIPKERYDPTKNYSYEWLKKKRKFLKGKTK